MKPLFVFSSLLLSLIFFGFGCQRSSSAGSEAQANRLQFSSGDTFEVRQTILGVGSNFTEVLTRSKEGVRQVQIESFVPHQEAALSWSLRVEQETSISQVARQKYFTDLTTQATGTHPLPPPAMITEHVATSGTINGIDLGTAHAIYLPSYWTTGPVHLARAKSGLWIAAEPWNGLTNTRHTILLFGSLDDMARRFVSDVSYVKNLIAALRKTSSTVSSGKDPTLLTLDADPIAWPITINGKAVSVSAFKAHNAYGEIVVLNNVKNPLILKLTINPLFIGGGILKGFSALENALGYQLHNFHVAKFDAKP
ncbi:hypothetical protein EXS71_04820 [Candidatus Uhrbacteria bacterium]|nr:hypothetical protein [Candidatus Uhrbacteria bacterium]